ncbi:N-acetyltransferase [[Clostridium] leptum]|uniref:N-acetyltransferase n=1 Tax=[Clostridium] leptum TaxID=1535 RepID=A0A412AZI7_9FIRM|nr:N-acetyltransferase [[Clostridium] leptum]
MLVKSITEEEIYGIGHAFGFYDYGEETGMTAAFSGREATADYICAYVRGMLRGGFLHTTSERSEGYIAYKLPKEKLGFQTLWPIAKGMLHNSTLKRLLRFAMAIKRGGVSLRDRMDKEKKPYIFVGLVCVREMYQGQGYMRKVLDIAFAEGDRLGVPVILETDAKSKCDKYVHLGMKLAGVRNIGEFGKLYDLIRYPESSNENGMA